MSRHPQYYRPELDVLRCVAFLLVFVHHAGLFLSGPLADVGTAGAFGVCLFFLLSAFLITELITREQDTTGNVRLGSFYIRRILRIWPLYVTALLVDFVHLHYTHPGLFPVSRLLAFLLLAGNWQVARHSFVGSLSLPLWSISIEEQFYVVWPSLQRHLKPAIVLLFCGAVILGSYCALFSECRLGHDLATRIWVNSFVQFQFFAAGASLSIVLRGRVPRFANSQRVTLGILGLFALYLAQSAFHAKIGPTPPRFELAAAGYFIVNVGCVLLFLAFLGASDLSRAKPLVYLGRISYGLYVFHFAVLSLCNKGLERIPRNLVPLPSFVRAGAALALTVMLASLSWRFVESPILRFKKRFEVVRTRTA